MARSRGKTLNRFAMQSAYEDENAVPVEEVDETAAADSAEAEAGAEGEDGKKKAKKKAPASAKRVRTPKVIRLKAIWRVYDGNGKEIADFPFNQKTEAEAFAAEKMEKQGEKKLLYYVLMKKVEMEE